MATTAPPVYSQATRPVRFECVLGPDVLLLNEFTGSEGVSRPFRYQIRLLSTEADLDPADLLLTEASLLIDLPGDETRRIRGIITRFAQGGTQDDDMTEYVAEIAPPFLVRTRSFRSRVFQHKNVPDIIKEILDDLQVEHEFDLRGSYAEREYCVQYRETDLDFISRLAEDEGLFYFFRHEESRVLLIITDGNLSAEPCPGPTTIRVAVQAVAGEDIVTSVRRESTVPLGKINFRTYDELQPSLDLEGETTGDGQGGDWYDYFPRRYTTIESGERLARLQLEAEEATQYILNGESTARNFQSGYTFDLDRGAGSPVQQLLLEVKHSCKMGPLRSRSADLEYRNSFVCIPQEVTYRPLKQTPRPVVRGCQTAVVVGPEGEEIHVDKYGRVKVQFHWDRLGGKNEDSSCWVRVGTPWAGKNWGMIHIPRIGQEVIVDFLEGDPDHPIIIGGVYNAEQMPPYALPDNMTQSGIKSRSSKQGGVDNANELRFEDKKGEEHVFLNAERNLRINVERNQIRTVGQHAATKVTGGRSTVVAGEANWLDGDPPDDHELADDGEVVGDYLEVAKDRYVWVGQSQVHEIDGDACELHVLQGEHIVKVKKDQTITVEEGKQVTNVKQGDQTIEVGQGNQKIEVNQGNQEIELGQGNQTIKLDMGNQTVELGMGNQTITVKMGNRSVKADLGKISEEAMQEIELKVGGNSIKIDQMGITIKGMMVKVEGQIQTEIKGLMTEVKGDAMLKAGGAITMIG
jgi:type VI secretion system secreted protein VgrG